MKEFIAEPSKLPHAVCEAALLKVRRVLAISTTPSAGDVARRRQDV